MGEAGTRVQGVGLGAEWLNFKCGIAPGTAATAAAREKMRVARGLFDLPLTSQAFQQGKLSYSKARSLTRIATPRTEEKLVDYALGATAQQLEKHCGDLRNVMRELSTPDANHSHQQRYLSRSFHGGGFCIKKDCNGDWRFINH